MTERFISNGWTVKAYDLSGNLVFESNSLERSLALQVYWDLHDCEPPIELAHDSRGDHPYSRIERVAFDRYGEKYSYNINPHKKESY